MPPRAQSASTQPKGKRGRKPGSKNTGSTKKKNSGKEADVLLQTEFLVPPQPKGKRGRKPGSKNTGATKKKNAGKKGNIQSAPKGKRGRKPGSKNTGSTKRKNSGKDGDVPFPTVHSFNIVRLEKMIRLQRFLEEKYRNLCGIYRKLAGVHKKPLSPDTVIQGYGILPPIVPKPLRPESEHPMRPAFWNYVSGLDLLTVDTSRPVTQPLICSVFKSIREHRLKFAYSRIAQERELDVYDPVEEVITETKEPVCEEETVVPAKPKRGRRRRRRMLFGPRPKRRKIAAPVKPKPKPAIKPTVVQEKKVVKAKKVVIVPKQKKVVKFKIERKKNEKC